MSDFKKEKLLINLKKAESLVGRIRRMVEEDKYCPEIMQQILAAIGLLRSVHKSLMEKHLRTCFFQAAESKSVKSRDELIREILKVTDLYNK